MKIRNIPQKPFPTVDSDMKSSNFEIKLKVFQHSTKRKLFAHHIINRIFQFFIILFFFCIFSSFRSFFISFFGFIWLCYCTKWGNVDSMVLLVDENILKDIVWMKPLVLMYGNSFLFVFFHLLWLRSFLSVKRIWMQSEMWVYAMIYEYFVVCADNLTSFNEHELELHFESIWYLGKSCFTCDICWKAIQFFTYDR